MARQDKQENYLERIQPRTVIILGIIIVFTGVSIWIQNVHRDPKNVFFGAVSSSLRTFGVTKNIKQDDGQIVIDRSVRLVTTPEVITQSRTKLTQKSGQAVTEVVSENIVTTSDNVSRYISIESDYQKNGKKLNFGGLEDKWFRENPDNTELNNIVIADITGLSPGYIAGSIPTIYLSGPSLQKSNQFLHDNAVYEPDLAGVKEVRQSGKSSYEYMVKVNVYNYLKWLEILGSLSGIKSPSIDAELFKNNQPIDLLMTISKDGRQLLKTRDILTGREETYSSPGARNKFIIPETTTKPLDIEQKLQDLLT